MRACSFSLYFLRGRYGSLFLTRFLLYFSACFFIFQMKYSAFDDETELLHQVFRLFDHDDSGGISVEEFEVTMRRLNGRMQEESSRELQHRRVCQMHASLAPPPHPLLPLPPSDTLVERPAILRGCIRYPCRLPACLLACGSRGATRKPLAGVLTI